MQLPIILANNEQNLKSLPKKAHDVYALLLGGADLVKKRRLSAEVLLIE
jgi:hypothetical protein